MFVSGMIDWNSVTRESMCRRDSIRSSPVRPRSISPRDSISAKEPPEWPNRIQPPDRLAHRIRQRGETESSASAQGGLCLKESQREWNRRFCGVFPRSLHQLGRWRDDRRQPIRDRTGRFVHAAHCFTVFRVAFMVKAHFSVTNPFANVLTIPTSRSCSRNKEREHKQG